MEGAFRQGLLTDPQTRLIETLLWDGRRYPRLPLHLARLARSARRLGFVCDREAAEAVLRAAGGEAPARVRLTLAADGGFAVARAPVPAPLPVWRLGLAAARLEAGDPWLTVKSTRREAYDRARAEMAAGLDEVVFLNGQGEVCDGTITTLFFDRGAGMRTPPLACGLLPGVLREELAVAEEVLVAQDLGRVRLWVGNALRGLVPAVWAG